MSKSQEGFVAARARAGLSMRRLASLSGVSLRTIARCEAEDRWPVYHDLRLRLQKALKA